MNFLTSTWRSWSKCSWIFSFAYYLSKYFLVKATLTREKSWQINRALFQPHYCNGSLSFRLVRRLYNSNWSKEYKSNGNDTLFPNEMKYNSIPHFHLNGQSFSIKKAWKWEIAAGFLCEVAEEKRRGESIVNNRLLFSSSRLSLVVSNCFTLLRIIIRQNRIRVSLVTDDDKCPGFKCLLHFVQASSS